MPRPQLITLSAFYFLLLVLFLYLPLLLLIVFSFNDARTLTLPLSGFTWEWYIDLWHSPELLEATQNSIVLGVGSSLVATFLGTTAAIGLIRFQFLGRDLFIAIAALPLVIPSVVLGVGMLLGFSQMNIPLSLWTVALGHTIINIPVVILIIGARLIGLPPNLEEAAMDLGATYWRTQLRVTFPLIVPAAIAAFLTAFTTSFDEFALTFFLVGTEPTLPIYLYSQLRFPSRLPMVVAMATLIIIGSMLLIFFTNWLRDWGPDSKTTIG